MKFSPTAHSISDIQVEFTNCRPNKLRILQINREQIKAFDLQLSAIGRKFPHLPAYSLQQRTREQLDPPAPACPELTRAIRHMGDRYVKKVENEQALQAA